MKSVSEVLEKEGSMSKTVDEILKDFRNRTVESIKHKEYHYGMALPNAKCELCKELLRYLEQNISDGDSRWDSNDLVSAKDVGESIIKFFGQEEE